MPTTLQRLNQYQGLYTQTFDGINLDISTYTNLWNVNNADIYLSGNDYFIDNRYVLVIAPRSESDVVLTINLDDAFIEADKGIRFVFTHVLKSQYVGYSAHSLLYNDIGLNAYNDSEVDVQHLSESSTIYASGNDYLPTANLWSAIRSNVMTYELPWDQEENYRGTYYKLIISNHGSQPIYLTLPNLVIERGWYLNTTMRNCATNMPDFYWEYDSKQTNPAFPFFRFVDILTYPIHDVMQIYADWYEYELGELPYYTNEKNLTTNKWALSTLTNHKNFREDYHPWTFNFVGQGYIKNIYSSNEPILTSTEREFLEWQLKTSYLGRGSGSKQALREAIQHVLIGSKLVSITPQWEGDIWVIKVYTLVSETEDVSASGQSSDYVLAAAELAKPMGYKIIHEALNAITLTLDNAEFGRLDYAQI
jgi:hypothetical protein